MLIKPIKSLPVSWVNATASSYAQRHLQTAHKEEVRGEEGRRQERRKKEETMGNGRKIRRIVKQRMSDNKQ